MSMATQQPVVRLMATGGTIANTDDGRIGINDLLADVPEARTLARLEPMDIIRIDSREITLDHWLQVARAVYAQGVALPETRAVVITHGTFTAEETAYFLHLTIPTQKPIVMVCSQRRHGTLGNDGDRNLVDAIRVANAPDAVGKGVMVVLNEEIHSARDVLKTNQRVSGFVSGAGAGLLGHVEADQVTFYRQPTRRHTARSEFNIQDIQTLPRVDIVSAYVGADGIAVDAFVQAGARGIVLNGFSFNGGPHPGQEAALARAQTQGVVVVRTNRGIGGRVPRSPNRPDVTGDNLSAQKARVLLMLALTKTREPREIQRFFDEY
jgi:L-asparaginase